MSRPNGYTAAWTAEDADYLRDNYGKLPAREIAAHLGRSVKAIYGQADLGGMLTRTSKPWTAAEEEVIRQNIGRMPEAEIGRLINRTVRSVRHHVILMGLSHKGAVRSITATTLDDLRHQTAAIPPVPVLVPRQIAMTTRSGRPISHKTLIAASVTHDYFTNVMSAEQAYILGLLAADGCVASRHPRVILGLQAKDAHLVGWVRDRLNPRANLCYTSTGFAKMQITSAAMVRDLARFGIVPRKSRSLEWPAHLGALLPYFLLGYFDGDGTAYLIRDKYPGWSVCSGSREFLEDMNGYILATTGVALEKIHHRPKTSLWQVATTSRGAYVMDQWLHQGGLGLSRKRFLGHVVARYKSTTRAA